MYEALVARARYHIQKASFMGLKDAESTLLLVEAADAIEELGARLEAHNEWFAKADKKIEEYKASYIAEHDARIAEVSKTPRWIPVTERLPKEGEFVLVYGDLYPNKHDGGVIAVSKRMDWNYWQGFGRERNISHWMPLPTPPTEEEGKT